MALRATSGPAQATRSLKVGEPLVVRAKVENSGQDEARVALRVEGAPHPMPFSPEALAVPRKSRQALEFAWTATLPDGTSALTYRGKLQLRAVADDKLVGEAPLDVYVSRG